MKPVITGPVTCLKCNHTVPSQTDLKVLEAGELTLCPNCETTLIDLRGGNMNIQFIQAESLTFELIKQ